MKRKKIISQLKIPVPSFMILIGFLFLADSIGAQQNWEVASYPDERGFLQRSAPMLQRIAAQGFGKRSLATSRCPDTGLPVKTWAVEGETIISPYTGRAYIQGPTGYFGPKKRNADGQITAFGGDPLKYDLPPATATLLLDPTDVSAHAFLSIPGNLRQQYHFACKNWARFYPLLAGKMEAEWREAFHEAVAQYEEARRPSDGDRELLQLSKPHNLIGEPEYLLGGNTVDGGTENHKTMWRTSALVYAQLFPEGSRISGYSKPEAYKLSREMIREYLKRLLETGNGEYDSQIYYPHSIEGFLNLYDFSTDPEVRLLAKFALDYYLATYALKVVDGAIAGGQKRGYLPGEDPGEMEQLLWAFFDRTSRDMKDAEISIQQATTSYRPNRVIYNLIRQSPDQPFSTRISRPFYHMDRYNAFQESYYRSPGFGLGNVYMSIVDNPNQQMVWSLIAAGKNGPMAFTGGQPYAQTSTGHSPYTQTLHHEGTLILLTTDSQTTPDADAKFKVFEKRLNPWHLPDTAQVEDFERANRRRYANKKLIPVTLPDVNDPKSWMDFWNSKTYTACSWLWIPKNADQIIQQDGKLFIAAHKTYVGILPIGSRYQLLSPSPEVVDQIKAKNLRNTLKTHDLLVVEGVLSGYVLEAVEAGDYASLEAFGKALSEKAVLDTAALTARLLVSYKNLKGDQLDMQYRPDGLKARGRVNGEILDYKNWNNGMVYEGPRIRVGQGRMLVSDGKHGYAIDFSGNLPVYQKIEE